LPASRGASASMGCAGCACLAAAAGGAGQKNSIASALTVSIDYFRRAHIASASPFTSRSSRAFGDSCKARRTTVMASEGAAKMYRHLREKGDINKTSYTSRVRTGRRSKIDLYVML